MKSYINIKNLINQTFEQKIEEPLSLYDEALNLAFNSSTTLAMEKYKFAFDDDPRYLEKTKSHYLPKYIQIETVRTCNAACVMCPITTPILKKLTIYSQQI